MLTVRPSFGLVLAFCVAASAACGETEEEGAGPGLEPTSSSSSTSSSGGGRTGGEAPDGGRGAATDAAPGEGPTSDAGSDATPPTKSTMTFFVTSTGSGAAGGNLGGLAGADAKCSALAAAVGGGDHTWRAYLSAVPRNGNPKVDARDRIGAGPWRNKLGVEIAPSNAALHAAGFVMRAADVRDENGLLIADATKRAILTGTSSEGRAFNGAVSNCENWTMSTANTYAVEIGRADAETLALATARWNSAGAVPCSETGMRTVNSEGRIYCFAAD